MLIETYSDALRQATQRTLEVMKLLAVVEQLTAAGQPQLVATLYRTWIDYNGDAPLLHAVYFNYGVVLTNLTDLEAAKNAYSEAIRLKPDFLAAYINLGHVYDRLGRPLDAITQWQALANALPTVNGENINFKTSALKQIGRVLERHNFDEHAEDALRLGLDLDQHQFDVLQHWLSLRQRQCKWPVVKPWGRATYRELLNGFSALSLGAYTDDPLLLLGNAYHFCKHNIGQPAISFADRHRHRAGQPTGPLKIGYLSSDLREHAIGFLTAEIYGLHDRTKVEVFVYYCGIEAEDPTKARIRGAADHWLDIGPMSDEEAAQRILADGIDILVDVNGYTNGARTKMLAMRPAPIIVNWLGFPGSMGSPYHHYIIADDFIIPPEYEIYYSEKVLRLPCYQPNDRHRELASEIPTRADAGLPTDAIVYCCFNGLHKITQFTWRRWMTILQEVPDSVLWLLEGGDPDRATEKRLLGYAAEYGVAAGRIIFAPKKRNHEHLIRYPLADLFLDTTPYGAHTTSSDALWMGVPVLTLAGRSFASRVCGSLIRSAGLGELVCEKAEKFVALAIELGRNRARLRALRDRLAAGRDTCVLFDTPVFVARLEELYAQMWQEFATGKLPRPNLVNLDIYNEIGLDLEDKNVELLTAPNYHALYEQRLARKDAFWKLPSDCRLWTEETAARFRKPKRETSARDGKLRAAT